MVLPGGAGRTPSGHEANEGISQVPLEAKGWLPPFDLSLSRREPAAAVCWEINEIRGFPFDELPQVG